MPDTSLVMIIPMIIIMGVVLSLFGITMYHALKLIRGINGGGDK